MENRPTRIKRQDILHVLAACIHMSLQDGYLEETETDFLNQLMEKCQLDMQEYQDTMAISKHRIEDICAPIVNNVMASDILMRCAGVMSGIDDSIDEHEEKFIHHLAGILKTEPFNAGNLRLDRQKEIVFNKIERALKTIQSLEARALRRR